MAESFNLRGTASIDTRPAEKKLAQFVKTAEKIDLKLSLKERNFTQPLGRITGAAEEFNKSLAASNARVVAFAASAGLMYSVQRALVSVTKSAIEVEHALAEINVILGATSGNLAKFGDQLFKIAGQTGQAFSTVTTAATELARQGLSMEETLKRTKDAMILTRLAGMDAAAAVDALTASINSFNKAAITSTEIVNKMATVDAAFAVSTNDLAEALKRVGSSAIDAGVSFDQLMAMTTSVQQITARGGAVIGNSLKSIFTRIQRTEVLDQLQMLGITVRNIKGQTLPAIQIMTQLAKTINTLSDAQKANITELMGGVFQINVVKAALGDLGKEYSIYQNALKVSNEATDAATRRNEKLNETLNSLVNKTFQNVKKAGAEVGRLTIAPALEGVLEKVNSALEKFDPKDSESTGNKIGKGILEGIGNFIKGPGLIIGLAVVGKLLQNFSKFASDSFKEFFNINEAAKKRLAMEKFISQELAQSEDLTAAILNNEISVADAEKVILKNLELRVAQQEKLNRLIKEASYGMSRRGAYASLIDEEAGTYAIKPKGKASGGFVPNFSQRDIQTLVHEELSSASYAKSGTKAVIDTLPGLGLHVRNTEETVTYAPGMKAPFINPPINSPEGRKHRDKAIRTTGMDPYASGSDSGVPNFAKGKKKLPKVKQLRSSNQSKGVLLPEFGRNDGNLTFSSTLAQVYPDTKSAERKKWEDKGFTGFKMTGVKAGRLRDKASTGFDSILDNAFEPGLKNIGSAITGSNQGKLPKKTTGKFSDYFDKKGWPQVKGRLFEAALNFVSVNMAGKAGMSARLDEIKGLTGGETWDFPNIKNQLASLYKINTGGNWDAKSNIDSGTQASIIKKTLSTKYGGKTVPANFAGFIPGFAKNALGITAKEAENGIEAFRSGGINQAQGLVTQINSSRNITGAQKAEYKKQIDAIRAQKKNTKNPKGITIDGTQLGTMLVPKVGESRGTGVAKPKLGKDNLLLRQYLSKHYKDTTGLDFNNLDEASQKRVVGSTKAKFPILGPSKGSNVNIVDDVATAIEKETRAFVASMKGSGEAKKANVLANLSTHQSSITSAAGAVFESGVKAAFDLEIGKTNDRFDTVKSPSLQEAFNIQTPYGEFKINDVSSLRQDMAAKILRQKLDMGIAADGFVPSFGKRDRNRIREARQAGVPYSQTYVSFVDTAKYKGPVVGNRKDEPTLQALKKAVQNHPDPKNAGMYASGFIPGFADEPKPTAPIKPMNLDSLGEGDKVAKNLLKKLQGFVKRLQKLDEVSGGLVPEVGEAVNETQSLIKKVEKGKVELEEIGSNLTELQTSLNEATTEANEAIQAGEDGLTELNGLKAELGELRTSYKDQQDAVELARQESKASKQALDDLPGLKDGYKALANEEEKKLNELKQAEQAAGGKERAHARSQQGVVMGDFEEEGMETGQTNRIEYTKQEFEKFSKAGHTGGTKAITTLTKTGPGQLGMKQQDDLAIALQKQRNAAIMGQTEEAENIQREFMRTHEGSMEHADTQDALNKVFQGNLKTGTQIGNKAADEAASHDKTAKLKRTEYEEARRATQDKKRERDSAQELANLSGKRSENLNKLQMEERAIGNKVHEQNLKINEQTRQVEERNKKTNEATAKTGQINKELEKELKAQQNKTREVQEGVQEARELNAKTEEVQQGLNRESEVRKNQSFGAGSFVPFSDQRKRYKGLKRAAEGDADSLAALGMNQSEAQSQLVGAKEERNQAFQSKAMVAAMALPMVTSTISQFAGGDQETEAGGRNSAMFEAMGQAGSMASLGAMFGPLGAGAGAVIGATMGIIDVLGKWEDKTYEFNSAAEQAAEKLTTFNNASQAYLKALTEFNDVITSETGVIKAEDTDRFRKNMSEALMAIPNEYRSRLSRAQGNVERIQEIFAEIQSDLQRDSNVKAAQAELATEIEERIPRGSGSMFEKKGDAGEKDQQKIFDMIKAQLDQTKFYGEEGEALAQKIRKASGTISSDFDGFKKALAEAGADPKTLELMTDMYDAGKQNVIELADEFEEFGFKGQFASKAGERLTSSILAYRNEMEKVRGEQNRLNAVMSGAQEQVKRLAGVLVDRLKFIDDMKNQRTAHMRNMGMTEIKGAQQVAQPFIDNLQKVQLGGDVQRADTLTKQASALEKLNSSIKINLVSTISGEFEKLTKTTERATQNTSEVQNSTNDELARQTKTLGGFEKALVESVKLAQDDSRSFQEISTGLEAVVKDSGLGESAQKALRDDIAAVVEKGNHDLALMADRHKNELEIQKLTLQYQKEAAENTKQISQLGTIGGFMQGGQADANRINKVFEDAATSSMRANSGMEGARSSMNILDLLRNFAGTSGAALPASMRQQAVSGVRQDLETKVERIRRGMEGTGQMTPELQQELNDLNNNLDEIAETKVAAQLKDVPTHLQSIADKIATLTDKTVGESTMQDSVTKALEAVMGGGSRHIVRPLESIEQILGFQKELKNVEKAQNEVADTLKASQKLRGDVDQKMERLAEQAQNLAANVPETLFENMMGFESKDIQNLVNNFGKGYAPTDEGLKQQTQAMSKLASTVTTLDNLINASPLYDDDARMPDLISETDQNLMLGKDGITGSLLKDFQALAKQQKSLNQQQVKLLGNNVLVGPAGVIEQTTGEVLTGKVTEGGFSGDRASFGASLSVGELDRALYASVEIFTKLMFKEVEKGGKITEDRMRELLRQADHTKKTSNLASDLDVSLSRNQDESFLKYGSPNAATERKMENQIMNSFLMAMSQFAQNNKGNNRFANLDPQAALDLTTKMARDQEQIQTSQIKKLLPADARRNDEGEFVGSNNARAIEARRTRAELKGKAGPHGGPGLLELLNRRNAELEQARQRLKASFERAVGSGGSAQVESIREENLGDIRSRGEKIRLQLQDAGLTPQKQTGVIDRLVGAKDPQEELSILQKEQVQLSKDQLSDLQNNLNEQRKQKIANEELTTIIKEKKELEKKQLELNQKKQAAEALAQSTAVRNNITDAIELKTPEAKRAFNDALKGLTFRELGELSSQYDFANEIGFNMADGAYPVDTVEQAMGGALLGQGSVPKSEALNRAMEMRRQRARGPFGLRNIFAGGREVFDINRAMGNAGFTQGAYDPMLPGAQGVNNTSVMRTDINDPFSILGSSIGNFTDDEKVISTIKSRFATIGEGADAGRQKAEGLAGKVIALRMKALEEFKNSDMSLSQYLAKLAEAELEIFREAASGKAPSISQAELASKLKAQIDQNLATGLNVDDLFAEFLHANMSMNKKDYENLARTVAESMASGLMGHKDGKIHSAQLVQGKGKKIVERVAGLKLGKSQTIAYSNALGEFEKFQMNFAQGLGGRAQLLASLNTKLQAALQNTRGTDGEIEKAYNEYIAGLTTGLKPQDIIVERKGIMDSVGKKVARNQVKGLDSSVEDIVKKYESQAASGTITEEGRQVLTRAEANLRAVESAEKSNLISTKEMADARKSYLDALNKHGADGDAIKQAYNDYAKSVTAQFKGRDLQNISTGLVTQFGQEMMGDSSGTLGADMAAITAKYNKAFTDGEISKGAVGRLSKAEGELKVAQSKAEAGVLSASQLTAAYAKFLKALDSDSNNIDDIKQAYEDFVNSMFDGGSFAGGAKLGEKDLIKTRTKLLQSGKQNTTRQGMSGFVTAVESITKTNQDLYNNGKITEASVQALNKAETDYNTAQSNWTQGLASTATLLDTAAKQLDAAVASGDQGKIQSAIQTYLADADKLLNPVDIAQRGTKFMKSNIKNVAKGRRGAFGAELLGISQMYETLVDDGQLTEKDGTTISKALADFKAAQDNFNLGLISQAQFMKAAENKLSSIADTAGSIEIKQAMEGYIKAAKTAIDPLSALQETGKDLAALGGGVLAKDLQGFKESILGINQSYDEAVNEGKVTRKNAKTLKKAAKDFTVAQDNFDRGMLSSADLISAAKDRLDKELKVNGPKTQEALQEYLNAIDEATTPLDKKQFNIGQITKFAQELTKAERRKFRASLQGQDFSDLDAARDRGDISRKEANQMKDSLAVIRKLEAEGAPADELRKAWDDYYKLRRRAFDNESEFVKQLNKFYENPKQRNEVLDEQRRNIVLQSRPEFVNTEQAQAFNENLKSYQQKLQTLAAERGLTEKELSEALQAEAEYQKMIIAFNKGRIGSRERIAGADAALKAKRKAGTDTADDFLDALQSRFTYGKNEAVHTVQDMVLSMVDSFESNLNDALYNAISGAKDVKEAFKDMADVMLNEITKMTIQASTRAIIGNLGIPGFGEAKTGGLITGGSGVKDDVPMLLQGGEFVMRKKSVDKFGSGFFKALNDSNIEGFSSGGPVGKLAGLVKEENRPDPVVDPQAGLDSQGYVGGKGAGFTMRNAFVYNDSLRPTKGSLEVDSRMSRRSLIDPDNPRNQIRMSKEQALYDYIVQKRQDVERYREEYQEYLDQKRARWKMAGFNMAAQLGLHYLSGGDGGAKGAGNAKDQAKGGIAQVMNDQLDRNNRGRMVAQMASGGSVTDSIPALLTAGEYVMSREAVQKYGEDTLRKLNEGRMAMFAEGGLVNGTSSVNAGPNASLGSSGATNNVNITVNVDNSGAVNSEISSNTQAERSAGSEREESNKLARTIEGAVMKVIIDQQKQGGMLNKLK